MLYKNSIYRTTKQVNSKQAKLRIPRKTHVIKLKIKERKKLK